MDCLSVSSLNVCMILNGNGRPNKDCKSQRPRIYGERNAHRFVAMSINIYATKEMSLIIIIMKYE